MKRMRSILFQNLIRATTVMVILALSLSVMLQMVLIRNQMRMEAHAVFAQIE